MCNEKIDLTGISMDLDKQTYPIDVVDGFRVQLRFFGLDLELYAGHSGHQGSCNVEGQGGMMRYDGNILIIQMKL